MRILNHLLGLIAAFALISALLITSVEAVVYWNPGYFEREYEKHRVLDDVHMEMDDLLEVTDHMMAYLRGDEKELQITAEINGDQRNFFNEREIAHMIDVKNLFLGGLAMRRLSLAVCLLCAGFLLWRKQGKVLPKMMIAGTGIFLGALALLGLIAAADFTQAFTVFHHIFFDNDLWILNPQTDLLINIVPEPFFIDTALRIGIVFAALLAITLAACAGVLRRKEPRKAHFELNMKKSS